jgi:hypothetical protein
MNKNKAHTPKGKRRPVTPRKCNEGLYENGKLIARCSQPWGVEHSHSDLTAREAVRAGIANQASAPADKSAPRVKSEEPGEYGGKRTDSEISLDVSLAHLKLVLQDRAALLAAAGDVLPDLEHYVATHGPGPDRRLAALQKVIANIKARGQ